MLGYTMIIYVVVVHMYPDFVSICNRSTKSWFMLDIICGHDKARYEPNATHNSA
jgi:hypothetical protein